MLSKRIPAYYILIAIVAGLVVTFAVYWLGLCPDKKPATVFAPSYIFPRLQGYQFIKPMLSAEEVNESTKYTGLKSNLDNEIRKCIAEGSISSAAVYMRSFSDEQWIAINNSEQFDPGSLLKLPILITILRMAEDDSSLLDREILFEQRNVYSYNQTFNTNKIQPGHKYSIRQLLRYMIAHSDNDATDLLKYNLDENQFIKTFSDLGMPVPSKQASSYPVYVKQFSIFMSVLYSGPYLTFRNSEFATSLLTECDFKDGMVKGVPPGTKVAHKFGEWNNQAGKELHEIAIVYCNDMPYLLTVMTKGKDIHKMCDVLARLSHVTYQEMSHREPNS